MNFITMLSVSKSGRGRLLLILAFCILGCDGQQRGGVSVESLRPLEVAHTKVGIVSDDGRKELRYVSMGDSAAAGPLVPGPSREPASCNRSGNNFPSKVASILGVNFFQDMTCSAALVENLFEPQGDNPPQLHALSADINLVTLGPIGANDINTTEVFNACGTPVPPGVGSSCLEKYPASGARDKFTERLEKVSVELGRALVETRNRAPNARVYVIGYGVYFPKDGCWPEQPYWPEAANYIQGLHDRVNAVLEEQAIKHGAVYVSQQTPDAFNHTTCAPWFQRWIVGLIPDRLAYPYHPSSIGMEATGKLIAETVKAALISQGEK